MDLLPFISLASTSGFTANTLFIGIGVYIFVRAILLVEHLIKRRLEKSTVDKAHNKRTTADRFVYERLAAELSRLGGERMQVIEFGNGAQNVATIPYIYMTATYEATCLGAVSSADKIQKVLTSLFSTFLLKLEASPYLILNYDQPEKEFPSTVYHYMEQRGARYTLYVSLTNPKSKQMIGFISYDNQCQDKITDEAIKTLRELAASIGTYLTIDSK